MKIKLSCTHCLDDVDFKILELLEKLDTWPSIEYISLKTGISQYRVKRSVRIIRRRIVRQNHRLSQALRSYLAETDETKENVDD